MPQVPDFPSATRLSTGDYYYVVTTGGGSQKVTIVDADSSPNQHNIVSLKSINHLKNFSTTNIPDGSIAHIKSYYEDYSDRGLGGGHFIWRSTSSATEDSGRYIRPSTNPSLGRWERTLNGSVPNVMMWGAKGNTYSYVNTGSKYIRLGTYGNPNGVSNDDTSAIRNALLACTFQWAGTLWFPNALYRITDTLYWNAAQTKLVGDGVSNNTTIFMDTGIQKDILVSITASGIIAHNDNPTIPTQPTSIGGHPHDQYKIESMAIGYAGPNYVDSYSGYSPWINTTNSVVTVSQAGEGNGIYNCLFFGGKYGIRTIGIGAPGPRIHDCSFVVGGSAAIKLEPFKYKSWNGSQWVWITGGGGALYAENISADYRGSNITGFSLIEVEDGGYTNVYIHGAKLEGEFRGGIINYHTNHNLNGHYGSINIENLNWNVTQTHAGFEDQTLVNITGSDLATRSVKTRILNVTLNQVPNLIKDYILRDQQNQPLIITSDFYGYQQADYQQMCIPEYYHYGVRSDVTINGENMTKLSYVSDRYSDKLISKFNPLQTGWYRIAVGMGRFLNSFNHDFYISSIDGIRKISAKSDSEYNYPQHKLESEFMSDRPIYGGFNVPLITRARLYRSTSYISGQSVFPTFLDIYVNRAYAADGISTSGQKEIKISCEMNGLRSANLNDGDNILLSPFLITGEKIHYGTIGSRYSEVDLTKEHDLHQYDGRTLQKTFGTTLLDKDLHLFVNSSRQLRLFDAGTTIEFSGGGASTQAVGIPLISNGILKHIIMSNSGAGYTSYPFIHIRPNTVNNGTGAFASGTVLGGSISRITIISGGDLYGRGPSSNTVGVSITTGT